MVSISTITITILFFFGACDYQTLNKEVNTAIIVVLFYLFLLHSIALYDEFLTSLHIFLKSSQSDRDPFPLQVNLIFRTGYPRSPQWKLALSGGFVGISRAVGST